MPSSIHPRILETCRNNAHNQHNKALERYYNNPNRCLFCGKIIEVERKVADARAKKFCDSSCSASFNNPRKTKKGNYTPDGRKSSGKCEICGNPVFGSGTKVCRSCHLSRASISTDSKTIKEMKRIGGYEKHAYQNIRSHAQRSADRFDMIKECLVCGYDKHVELCHKTPIFSFNEDTIMSVVNRKDNLVYLCPNHHWELDHGLLESNIAETEM